MDESKSVRVGLLRRAAIRRRESGRILAWRIHQFLHAREDETLDERQVALDAHRWIDNYRAVCRYEVLYEAAATPITYWIVNNLKRAEGIDVYDRGTNFNPFARNRSEQRAMENL